MPNNLMMGHYAFLNFSAGLIFEKNPLKISKFQFFQFSLNYQLFSYTEQINQVLRKITKLNQFSVQFSKYDNSVFRLINKVS